MIGKERTPSIDEVLKRARNISGEPSYICPICGNGSGRDGTGITEDKNRPGHYHCFKCGFDGDIYNILDAAAGAEPGTSFCEYSKGETETDRKPKKAQGQEVKRRAPAKDFSEYIKKCAAAIQGSDGEAYLLSRGFTSETLARFGIGYDEQKKAVVIPYPGENYYITRSISGKEFRKPPINEAGAEPIFNAEALEKRNPVYIVESQLDAISILQEGAAAVAVGGSGARKIEEYAGNMPRVLFVLADNDEAGENTARNIQNAVIKKGASAYVIHPPAGAKDANDILKASRDRLRYFLDENHLAETEYRNNESAASFIAQMKAAAEESKKPITTGFRALDEQLDGGFYPGLYVIGAISSLGKTTLCIQMAENAARQFNDVLFFSLEMSRFEVISKTISRLTYEFCSKKEDAKTARQILNGKKAGFYSPDEQKLIEKAFKEFSIFGKNIWIDEGLGNIGINQIRSAVQKHIDITGKTPLVIIDYLQILAPDNDRMTDKQAIDKNVFELKRISREFSAPVLAISSFNRESYSTSLKMSAFKESGAIEYSSDVLIGLQPQGIADKETATGKSENAKTIDECKRAENRDIELKILKNRNGKTGGTVNFVYTPMFNNYKEAGNVNRQIKIY